MISIIIPVYNTEKYVERCIKSVASQSFSDIELICVDDASSDGSYQVLERLAAADSRIKLYRNATNRGAGYTKNKALRHATGEYVCFVDSDDWLVEDALEMLHESAVNSNAEDVFYLSYSMTESADKLVSGISAWRNFPATRMYSGLQFLDAMLDEKCLTVGACHHFVKRNLVLRHASFSEGTVNDDMKFSCNLLANVKRLLFLKKELYVYFHRCSGSISNTAKSACFANECIAHGILLYGTLRRQRNGLADSVARKLLKNSVLTAKNIAFALPQEEKCDFISKILNETSSEGERITVSGKAYASLRGKAIYIYGAGAYAIDICRQLFEHEIDIKGFIVSKAAGDTFAGKPLFSVADFPVPQNATLIIGTSEKFYDEILSRGEITMFSKVVLSKDLTAPAGTWGGVTLCDISNRTTCLHYALPAKEAA